MTLSLKDEPSDSFLNDCIRLAEKYAGSATVGALVDEIARLRSILPPPLVEPKAGERLDAAVARLEDAVIPLLDKHADEALEYLKMNAEEGTDLDTRTVIWNQMSALLSEFSAFKAALKEKP